MTGIALVDDDEFFRFITTKQLVKAGIESETIEPFIHGQAALEALISRDATGEAFPEIVFLDINMPIIDGWQFLDKWHSYFADRYNDVRIYICTSSLDNEDMHRARNHPLVHDYLVKPINADVIRHIITDQKVS